MPKLTPEEIDEMLLRSRDKMASKNLRIATLCSDGSPWIVPVSFVYRDRTIFLTARARVQWLENIRHDPRVAVSIDDSDYIRRKVTIRGRAEIRFEPGMDDEWRDLRLPLRSESWTGPVRRSDGSEEWTWGEAYTAMTWDEPRALVALPLDGSKVTSWRMPVVGEYLDEAWSSRYFHNQPKRFRIAELGDTPATWRVIAEP